MPPEEYTIEIPGIADVFILPVPALNNPELKRQRIRRMKEAVTPVPEVLQWIPPVITAIDDAQDMLIVGLVLGKFLIRRAAPRLIPYVGWALLASDVMNMAVSVLATSLTGRPPKRAVFSAMRTIAAGKAGRIKRVAPFLQKTNWFSFGIQAGQVAESLTGMGLRLGAIMGALTAGVWGGIRALGGAQVRIVAPPEADPLSKAARYLNESSHLMWTPGLFSAEDQQLLIAAQNIAIGIVTERGDPVLTDYSSVELGQTEVAIYTPWEQSTLQALEDEGVPVNGALRPYVNSPNPRVTYAEATRLAADRQTAWELETRELFGPTVTGTVMQLIHNEAALDTWDFLSEESNVMAPAYDPVMLAAAAVVEHGVFLPPAATPEQYASYLARAVELSEGRALFAYNVDLLTSAALETVGAWETRPIGEA